MLRMAVNRAYATQGKCIIQDQMNSIYILGYSDGWPIMFSFPIEDLRKIPRVGYLFRYPPREKDFRSVDSACHHLGNFAVKSLYRNVKARSEVDRQSWFSGDIAAFRSSNAS